MNSIFNYDNCVKESPKACIRWYIKEPQKGQQTLYHLEPDSDDEECDCDCVTRKESPGVELNLTSPLSVHKNLLEIQMQNLHLKSYRMSEKFNALWTDAEKILVFIKRHEEQRNAFQFGQHFQTAQKLKEYILFLKFVCFKFSEFRTFFSHQEQIAKFKNGEKLLRHLISSPI